MATLTVHPDRLLLAYAGSARGHDTIAAAVADPMYRRWLEQWWDDAAPQVPLPAADVAAYRAALIERFANQRIRHTLAQIAPDGSQKLPIRCCPCCAGSGPPAACRPGEFTCWPPGSITCVEWARR